jgi:hypothetical protein
MQPLPQKENQLFRQVVKLYEGKHYKKGKPCIFSSLATPADAHQA